MTRVSVKSKFLSLAIVSMVAGCAFMNRINPEDIRGGVWNRIQDSGIARDASHARWGDKVRIEGKTNHFTAEDEKVTYWAHFASGNFLSPDHVSFQARWYDPDGNVYLEDTFPLNSLYDAQFVKTHLPIKDFPIRHFPGLWQVEIYYQGHKIDRKEFHILPWDPGTYLPEKTAKPTSEKISQLWESVNERRRAEEDRAFLEKFGRARALIHKGRLGEAKLLLDEILKDEPYRTEAHLGLAAVYCEVEKWDKALAELDYVMQNPDYRAKAMVLRDEIIEMSSHQKQELSYDPR
jgi:hypothetical protein